MRKPKIKIETVDIGVFDNRATEKLGQKKLSQKLYKHCLFTLNVMCSKNNLSFWWWLIGICLLSNQCVRA